MPSSEKSPTLLSLMRDPMNSGVPVIFIFQRRERGARKLGNDKTATSATLLGRLRQGAHEFKVSLGYRRSIGQLSKTLSQSKKRLRV